MGRQGKTFVYCTPIIGAQTNPSDLGPAPLDRPQSTWMQPASESLATHGLWSSARLALLLSWAAPLRATGQPDRPGHHELRLSRRRTEQFRGHGRRFRRRHRPFRYCRRLRRKSHRSDHRNHPIWPRGTASRSRPSADGSGAATAGTTSCSPPRCISRWAWARTTAGCRSTTFAASPTQSMPPITTGDNCGSRTREQSLTATDPEHYAHRRQASPGPASRNVCQNQISTVDSAGDAVEWTMSRRRFEFAQDAS
jgi:hypothetical protein